MNPDTIVLIHGFWVTAQLGALEIPLRAAGLPVPTPAHPGFEVEVEALNADPTPIENLTVPAVIDHLTEVIGGLERPPILMGHSAGGVFTPLMLDRGYGAVGVVMNSAPTEGVPVVLLSQLKSTFPVLRAIGRKKAAGFTLEQWRYAFTNTFTEEESKALYERYHIPGQYGCCGAVRWPPWSRATRTPSSTMTTTTGRRCCSSPAERTPPHASERPALQRQALQVQHRDRGQGVPRLRPLPTRPEGLGADRGRRPGLGRGARMVTTAAPDPVPSPSRVTQAA